RCRCRLPEFARRLGRNYQVHKVKSAIPTPLPKVDDNNCSGSHRTAERVNVGRLPARGGAAPGERRVSESLSTRKRPWFRRLFLRQPKSATESGRSICK